MKQFAGATALVSGDIEASYFILGTRNSASCQRNANVFLTV